MTGCCFVRLSSDFYIIIVLFSSTIYSLTIEASVTTSWHPRLIHSFSNIRMSSTKMEAESDVPVDGGKGESSEYIPTSRDYAPRYTGPSVDEMTDEQKSIRDAIIQSRPRTGLAGPFGPWLAVPEIARSAQSLGRACRYGTSLSFRESELVILLTGAKMRSHTEFDLHVEEAMVAGMSMQVIQAIPRDEDFSVDAVREKLLPVLNNDRERAIALFTAELVHCYGVSDETYDITKKAVDNQDSVLVEITSIAGYYAYVSFTLNVFRIPSSISRS